MNAPLLAELRPMGWLEAELERKAALYPNRRGVTLGRRYFLRRKPAARRNAASWYSFEDINALPELDDG